MKQIEVRKEEEIIWDKDIYLYMTLRELQLLRDVLWHSSYSEICSHYECCERLIPHDYSLFDEMRDEAETILVNNGGIPSDIV